MTKTRQELIEEVSADIHKCYCRAYERRFGKPYWTNGDYSKLDEPTKDYDREMAIWHLADLKEAIRKVIEPLKEVFEWTGKRGQYNFSRRYELAIDEALKIAKEITK